MSGSATGSFGVSWKSRHELAGPALDIDWPDRERTTNHANRAADGDWAALPPIHDEARTVASGAGRRG